jgi:hypothetical protein
VQSVSQPYSTANGSQFHEFCGRLPLMTRPLYRPTSRQALALAAIAALALGYGFYLRYGLIEQSAIGIACESGGTTWTCAARRTAIALFTPQVFGVTALGAALLNLVRPSVVFWAVALLAAGAGIVLYNVALSALAVALLILSLARPVPEAS